MSFWGDSVIRGSWDKLISLMGTKASGYEVELSRGASTSNPSGSISFNMVADWGQLDQIHARLKAVFKNSPQLIVGNMGLMHLPTSHREGITEKQYGPYAEAFAKWLRENYHNDQPLFLAAQVQYWSGTKMTPVLPNTHIVNDNTRPPPYKHTHQGASTIHGERNRGQTPFRTMLTSDAMARASGGVGFAPLLNVHSTTARSDATDDGLHYHGATAYMVPTAMLNALCNSGAPEGGDHSDAAAFVKTFVSSNDILHPI